MIKLEVISIELRQLEYFLAVSKELHFTKAAEKLNISQPSLSQQIRALEHEVGMPLFDRIGKKISLTEAGRVLLSHSKTIFHEVEQARSRHSRFKWITSWFLNNRIFVNRSKLFTTTSYIRFQ